MTLTILQTIVCKVNTNIRLYDIIIQNPQKKSGLFMEVYKMLRMLRNKSGLTQKQVAEYLGMKQQQYSNYELGLRCLPIDKLRSLCMLYSVSADYILALPADLEYPGI